MPNRPKLPCRVDSLQWAESGTALAAETGLVHCAHIPPQATAAAPAPLVLMLHGWAGNEAAMWIFKQTVPPGVAIVTPRAPVDLQNGGFAWFSYGNYHQFEPERGALAAALDQLAHFLHALPRFYPVDPTRTLLMGFSQGAITLNAFIFSNPDDAIGAASLAGAMPPVYGSQPQANLLAGLPVFIAHGSRDEVIPVAEARKTRDVYTAFGADVTYGEYPAAHKMHVQAMKDMQRWLARLFPNVR
ncbi:MAG: hypothetical protein D6768_06590 [Chloroflexi bacterium]|nr:MAG: hypothetical protein D6768_06590 [Chloroflexota bacterium]